MTEHPSQVEDLRRQGAETAVSVTGRRARQRRFAAVSMHPGRALATVAVTVTALLAGAVQVSATPARPTSGPEPVAALDLARYLGSWYQLAAVPQFFNLGCARDTRAEYTALPNGDVAVRNSCTTWAGTTDEIRGAARIRDPRTGAQLRVAFPGVPTQESLDGPPNYLVTALGPDYTWALVTDPDRISGFVLSREPVLAAEQWGRVRTAIDRAGENPCLYLTTPVTGGRDDITPLCLA